MVRTCHLAPGLSPSEERYVLLPTDTVRSIPPDSLVSEPQLCNLCSSRCWFPPPTPHRGNRLLRGLDPTPFSRPTHAKLAFALTRLHILGGIPYWPLFPFTRASRSLVLFYIFDAQTSPQIVSQSWLRALTSVLSQLTILWEGGRLDLFDSFDGRQTLKGS